MLKTILIVIEVLVSAGLVTVVLLQQRGSGLGGAFGGGGNVYYQRRGIEKILFYATIALAVALMVIALALLRIA